MPGWVEMHLQLCFSKRVYGSEKKEMRPLAAKIRFPITGSGRGQPWEHHFLFCCFRQLEFFPPPLLYLGSGTFSFNLSIVELETKSLKLWKPLSDLISSWSWMNSLKNKFGCGNICYVSEETSNRIPALTAIRGFAREL